MLKCCFLLYKNQKMFNGMNYRDFRQKSVSSRRHMKVLLVVFHLCEISQERKKYRHKTKLKLKKKIILEIISVVTITVIKLCI